MSSTFFKICKKFFAAQEGPVWAFCACQGIKYNLAREIVLWGLVCRQGRSCPLGVSGPGPRKIWPRAKRKGAKRPPVDLQILLNCFHSGPDLCNDIRVSTPISGKFQPKGCVHSFQVFLGKFTLFHFVPFRGALRPPLVQFSFSGQCRSSNAVAGAFQPRPQTTHCANYFPRLPGIRFQCTSALRNQYHGKTHKC